MAQKKKTPYQYDQRKYFNWAAGVRATDKYHKVAQDNFDKITRLEKDGKYSAILKEGHELAEDTRNKLATLMHCDPTLVFFANSATCASMPLLIALFNNNEGLKRDSYYFGGDDLYAAISEYVFDRKSVLKQVITNQNFHMMSAPFDLQHECFLKAFYGNDLANVNWNGGYNCRIYSSRSYLNLEGLSKEDKNVSPIIIVEHLNRAIGKIYSQKLLSEIGSVWGSKHIVSPVTLLDGSHTLGALDFDVTKLCGAFIASASKSFGAEPTTGMGYASGSVMKSMESSLPPVNYPVAVFQFHPDSPLAIGLSDVDYFRSYFISLPELASLNASVTDLLNEGVSNRYLSLLNLKKKLASALLKMHATSDSVFTIPSSGKFRVIRAPIMPDNDPNLVSCQDMHNDETRFTLPLDYFQESPNYLTFFCDFDFAEDCARKISRHRYSIGELMKICCTYGFYERSLVNRYLRFSFRHDVDHDFQGLLDVLVEIANRMVVKGMLIESTDEEMQSYIQAIKDSNMSDKKKEEAIEELEFNHKCVQGVNERFRNTLLLKRVNWDEI